jgi:TolB-like protein
MAAAPSMRRPDGFRIAASLLGLLLILAGCSFGPGNIQTQHSTDLEARRIRRIAVVPASILAPEQKPRTPFTSPTVPDVKPSEQEAPESLSRLVYSTMAALPGWQIVSDNEVREIGPNVPLGGDTARLRRIGEMVYADAVMTGHILRYRERVGNELGVKSPASVAFTLELVDVRRGDVIWSARFDETQRSLSENVFGLGDIIRQGGIKWLAADQLMHEGIKKAIADLHDVIAAKQK